MTCATDTNTTPALLHYSVLTIDGGESYLLATSLVEADTHMAVRAIRDYGTDVRVCLTSDLPRTPAARRKFIAGLFS